jgi:hypothetical protein
MFPMDHGRARGARHLSRLSLLAAAILATGCGPKGDATRAPASEREGAHGALRFHLKSQVEPARVTLGDRAVWRLTAELPVGAAPGTLLRERADSALEITPLAAPRAFRRDNKTTWSASFGTRGFDIGRLPLPRVLLPTVLNGASDTLEFPPDTLFVDSLTPAMTGAVEPDRGALPTELRPVDYLVAALGALLLAGLVAAAIWLFLRARRRGRMAEEVGAAPEPPETLFQRAIEVLRGEVASLPRDRFYDRLSLAVRSYVSAVTGVPALDRTTWELERELAELSDLRGETIAAVGRVLRRSDMAKFARQEDPLAEAASALDEAAALVGRFRPEPSPAPLGSVPGTGPAPSSERTRP